MICRQLSCFRLFLVDNVFPSLVFNSLVFVLGVLVFSIYRSHFQFLFGLPYLLSEMSFSPCPCAGFLMSDCRISKIVFNIYFPNYSNSFMLKYESLTFGKLIVQSFIVINLEDGGIL